MKPTAPPLSVPEGAPDSSLQSEIARACETANDERITIPAPPTAEALKAATPCPPPDEEYQDEGTQRDTTPAPPPTTSAIRKRDNGDDGEEEPAPETIPGAPPVPKIYSM